MESNTKRKREEGSEEWTKRTRTSVSLAGMIRSHLTGSWIEYHTVYYTDLGLFKCQVTSYRIVN